MNDINEMPPVCGYCPYWEVCKPPYICPDIGDKKPKRTEERTETHACDLISRAMLLEYIHNEPVGKMLCDKYNLDGVIKQLPSAQPKSYREGYQAGFKDAQPECAKDFVMLKVIDLNGRPYYSIIYLEDGREYEGYASYDLMVISEYLKRYFGFAQPEIIRCRECKLRDTEYCNMAHGFMGMKDDDFCSYAERREVSE